MDLFFNNETTKRLRVLVILLGFCCFVSCTDIVDVDIPDSNNERLVVDGLIFNADTSISEYSVIILSKSVNFNDDIDVGSNDNAVTGAIVNLESLAGDKFFFNESFEGKYLLENKYLEADKSYRLQIETAEGVFYESTYQKNHAPVRIDSLGHFSYDYLVKNGYLFDFSLPIDRDYLVLSFTDRKNEDNFYAWMRPDFRSDVLDNIKILSDEAIGDGGIVPFEYLWFDIPVRDVNNFEFYQVTLNENAYHFLKEAKALTELSSPFSTPPSTPSSNIHNINDSKEQVLGFFEIATADVKRFVW